MLRNYPVSTALVAIFFALQLSYALAEMKVTPFGLRPEECIFEHPSGTHIMETQGGVKLLYPNGTNHFVPEKLECVMHHRKWLMENERFKHIRENRTAAPRADGWLDNAYFYLPNNAPGRSFAGNYLVPAAPSVGPKNFWLYYFLGLVNFQSTVVETILQPVLTYSSSGWTFASWNCCPSGQAHNSAAVPTSPGQTVYGNMYSWQNKWTVHSVSGSKTSDLVVAPMNRIFNYADATLETYYVGGCDYYPTNTLKYTNMLLVDTNGKSASPSWSTTSATVCNGNTKVVDPWNINISHN